MCKLLGIKQPIAHQIEESVRLDLRLLICLFHALDYRLFYIYEATASVGLILYRLESAMTVLQLFYYGERVD